MWLVPLWAAASGWYLFGQQQVWQMQCKFALLDTFLFGVPVAGPALLASERLQRQHGSVQGERELEAPEPNLYEACEQKRFRAGHIFEIAEQLGSLQTGNQKVENSLLGHTVT